MKDISISEKKINVLSLEDCDADFEIIRENLADAGFNLNIMHVEREAEFEAALRSNNFDIILADFRLPGFDAFGALKLCGKICPDVPFICISGAIGEVTAIELMKNGATDYVMKDKLDRLSFAVKRALKEAEEKVALKRAEEKIRENELKLSTIAGQLTDLIALTDATGLITYASPASRHLFQFEPEEMCGCHFTQFLQEEDIEIAIPKFRDAIDFGRPSKTLELTMKRKDGSLFSGELNGSLFPPNEFSGTLVVIRDITGRKKMEQELLDKINDLQRFHDLTVDREIYMIELKKEVNELLKRIGSKEKYNIAK
jgi:PAS domain S-box-containing protein